LFICSTCLLRFETDIKHRLRQSVLVFVETDFLLSYICSHHYHVRCMWLVWAYYSLFIWATELSLSPISSLSPTKVEFFGPIKKSKEFNCVSHFSWIDFVASFSMMCLIPFCYNLWFFLVSWNKNFILVSVLLEWERLIVPNVNSSIRIAWSNSICILLLKLVIFHYFKKNVSTHLIFLIQETASLIF